MHVSVEDLKRLFSDVPEKLFVGRKVEMVQEFVKMLYFEYTLETEVMAMMPRTTLSYPLTPAKNTTTLSLP